MWLTNDILREVIYKKNTVCCLCFEVTGEDDLRQNDEIYLPDSDHSIELSTIVFTVFGNKILDSEFLSHSVCRNCAKSALSAFRFIVKCTTRTNTMMNTISNLNEITEKKTVRGRGMYIIADPSNFQGKVICDSRKTDTPLRYIARRYQMFSQLALRPIKCEKENVGLKSQSEKENVGLKSQCDTCGRILHKRSIYGHVKKCKGRIDSAKPDIDLDIKDKKKKINDTKKENAPSDAKQEQSNENHSDVEQYNERNDLGDESDSWHAEEERKKTERRSYMNNLEKVSCEHCGTSVRNKYYIERHMIFACKEIPQSKKEILKTKYEAKKAQKEALKKQIEMIEATGGDVKSYKLSLLKRICEFCGKTLASTFYLKKHLFTCKGLDESKRTEEYITALLDLKPHRPYIYKKPLHLRKIVKAENVSCSYCDQSFKSKTALSQHIYKDCKNIPVELKYAVCTQCGKKCKRNNLKSHEKSHTQRFPCGKCGKVFKNRKAIKRHLRMPDCVNEPYAIPEPVKKFSCHVCGKLFVHKANIDNHFLQFHTESGGFQCQFCEKRFGRKDSLKVHMVVHTKVKNFGCDICGGKFVSNTSLKYHVRTHTGEKPYKCQYCDDRFLSASRRNIHTRIKHLPPKLECKYCLKKFCHWAGLSKHRKRHFEPGSSLYMPELGLPVITKNSYSSDSENEY